MEDNIVGLADTTQSSTVNGRDSGRGVDGLLSTDPADGHCFQTGYENNSWWAVDLGYDTTVHYVSIMNIAGIESMCISIIFNHNKFNIMYMFRDFVRKLLTLNSKINKI